jgi:ribosome modulation factor
MTDTDAFQKGYDAYWDGLDVTDSPYDEGSEENLAWHEGWYEARRHDYDESEE